MSRVGAPRRQLPESRGLQVSVKRLLPAACGAAAIVLTAGSFVRERYALWVFVPAALVTGGLLWRAGWWRRRALSAALLLDLLLVFGYLWSLDESVSVTVRVTPAQVTAQVGSDTIILPVRNVRGQVGLVAGSLDTYRVQPTGEAFDFSSYNQSNGNGTYLETAGGGLAAIGRWFRLSTPLPGWSDASVLRAGRSVPLLSGGIPPASGWQRNVRGELTGRPGSVIALSSALRGSYTVSARLWRGDGTQGILVGLSSTGDAYLLGVRMDQPDVVWFKWSAGGLGDSLTGRLLHPAPLPMLQRDIRLVLGNVIGGLALLLLFPLVYVALAAAFSLVGGDGDDDVRAIERVLQARWAPVALTVVMAGAACTASLFIAVKLLQEIPHVQDSVAYLFQARTLALGRLSVPAPALPTFFAEEFIPVLHGEWFGKYPPGWPVLLAAGVLLHVPWLVDPVLTAFDLVLIVLIGREVYDLPVALLAGLLALTSPFFLFMGGSFMAHTATLLYLGAFALLLIHWLVRVEKHTPIDPRRWLVPAGFLFGMAFITRQLDALAFAAPFAGALVLPGARKHLLSAGWLAVGAVPPAVALLLYNRALTGSAFLSPYAVWGPNDHPGFGSRIGALGGFTFGQGLWNTSLNLQMLLAHLWGWPFYLTLALAAVPFVLGRATRWDLLFLASAVALIAAYAFYWAAGLMYGPRYYYVALPWFALLSARGVQELFQLVLRLRLPWHDRFAALSAAGLLLAALFAYDLAVYIPAQIPVYRGYNYVSAASLDAVRAARVHHALIFVGAGGDGGWWEYGSVFSQNSPLLNGDIVYARDQGAANSELMRRYPGRRYFLLNGTTLTSLH